MLLLACDCNIQAFSVNELTTCTHGSDSTATKPKVRDRVMVSLRFAITTNVHRTHDYDAECLAVALAICNFQDMMLRLASKLGAYCRCVRC
jgi:hypothetical protein